MSYYYVQSESNLWTVGTGTRGKGGDWEPESDHSTPKSAALRVAFLNGGGSVPDEAITNVEQVRGMVREINDANIRIAELEKAIAHLAEVHHIANFHNVTHAKDWRECDAITCRHAQRALEGETK